MGKLIVEMVIQVPVLNITFTDYMESITSMETAFDKASKATKWRKVVDSIKDYLKDGNTLGQGLVQLDTIIRDFQFSMLVVITLNTAQGKQTSFDAFTDVQEDQTAANPKPKDAPNQVSIKQKSDNAVNEQQIMLVTPEGDVMPSAAPTTPASPKDGMTVEQLVAFHKLRDQIRIKTHFRHLVDEKMKVGTLIVCRRLNPFATRLFFIPDKTQNVRHLIFSSTNKNRVIEYFNELTSEKTEDWSWTS